MKLTSDDETLAENKVLILYILNKIGKAISNDALLNLVLAVTDMNYFYFQQFLLDLLKVYIPIRNKHSLNDHPIILFTFKKIILKKIIGIPIQMIEERSPNNISSLNEKLSKMATFINALVKRRFFFILSHNICIFF